MYSCFCVFYYYLSSNVEKACPQKYVVLKHRKIFKADLDIYEYFNHIFMQNEIKDSSCCKNAIFSKQLK